MKKIILFAIVGLMIFTSACAKEKEVISADNSKIDWLINLEEAQEIAKSEGKVIFVHFTGSDWCGWCTKLETEVYDHEPFIKYTAENLVMVKLDFPKSIKQSAETKKYNKALSVKYKIQGFPTVLLLDAEGKIIGKTGYQYGGSEKYVEHLKELLSKKG